MFHCIFYLLPNRGPEFSCFPDDVSYSQLWKIIGEEYADMQQIHKVSKATIGLLVDSEADNHAHSFLDLVGTVEQVKMAEELILDKALQAS